MYFSILCDFYDTTIGQIIGGIYLVVGAVHIIYAEEVLPSFMSEIHGSQDTLIPRTVRYKKKDVEHSTL